MRRLAFVIVFGAFLLSAASAQAKVGLSVFDVAFLGPNGEAVSQAGSHPFALQVSLVANTVEEGGRTFPDEAVKDLEVTNVPGLAGDPTAVPPCSTLEFLVLRQGNNVVPECPDSSAVGVARIDVGSGEGRVSFNAPVYDLGPPPGSVAKLGFYVQSIPVTIDFRLTQHAPYRIVAHTNNISQVLEFFGAQLTLWGIPADPRHDKERGLCETRPGTCPAGVAATPFLTLPRACTGPLSSEYSVDSWQHRASHLPDGEPDLSDPAWTSGATLTHGEGLPPEPQGMSGCGSLGFGPTIAAQPTTRAASSPTGLDFSLDVADEGLVNPKEGAITDADVKKTVVTLPEGFSTNPSLAEGLNVCSEADLARETVNSAPGAGCPDASKIGTVEVETPLLEENVNGALYIATPYENQVGSLLALYMVIKNPTLGIIVTQALKVEPDPVTGQIVTIAENLPELPFSHFKLHFREGTRSPLASPPLCGTYDASALLYPSSGGAPLTTTSAFEIISGPDAGPCPSGTSQPFHPGLEAGTINNAAAHYSPFYTRLSRNDSEQEITHFSIKLPPGVIGKLAGIPYCSDAAIAAATARTGPHGGQEELNSPSCPAASEVGHTLAGAGVGPSLAYAPGKLYLAGPYHGSALSLVAITAAKVGPFDLGTVVVRFALKINPETAEVFVDATGSDPLPHIIKGIPVHLRDIRAYVDRPNFVLNPTSCARTSTASTVLGSGSDFGSEADDQPVTVTSPFQAADCASLGFAPKLALSLKGSTKRGGTPALKAVLTYPKGSYANIASAQVTLPHSEFLEQSHIKTICTRVQFAAGGGNGEQCPAASIYGRAKAVTPLLSTPLEGPVYLRSSSHNLPDLVAALHNGQINIDLDGRIDSVKGGRIRNTFEAVPDAPVTSFTLELQGAKKGLLVNSTNLCNSTNRAIADFTGQNGKVHDFNPVLQAQCPKGRKGKGKGKRLALRARW
jgi:hypothetical protein